MITLNDFLKDVSQRPMPQHPMTRVRTLAKELAEGAVNGLWEPSIRAFRGGVTEENVVAYFQQRWGDTIPRLELLISTGYATYGVNELLLLRPAFELLDETEPTNIFISYKRSESSAFALLVLARLKMAGLEPFLDMALVPGEDWQTGLKTRIQSYDYLIVLLGKETLNSEVTRQEILWAKEAGLTILPVWHNGFLYRSSDWAALPPELDNLLSHAHTIRVIEESAVGYNNAIVELLNRFGVTP